MDRMVPSDRPKKAMRKRLSIGDRAIYAAGERQRAAGKSCPTRDRCGSAPSTTVHERLGLGIGVTGCNRAVDQGAGAERCKRQPEAVLATVAWAVVPIVSTAVASATPVAPPATIIATIGKCDCAAWIAGENTNWTIIAVKANLEGNDLDRRQRSRTNNEMQAARATFRSLSNASVFLPFSNSKTNRRPMPRDVRRSIGTAGVLYGRGAPSARGLQVPAARSPIRASLVESAQKPPAKPIEQELRAG
jgi:hypothetical protein